MFQRFSNAKERMTKTRVLLIDVGIISHDIVKIKWFFKREREKRFRRGEEIKVEKEELKTLSQIGPQLRALAEGIQQEMEKAWNARILSQLDAKVSNTGRRKMNITGGRKAYCSDNCWFASIISKHSKRKWIPPFVHPLELSFHSPPITI